MKRSTTLLLLFSFLLLLPASGSTLNYITAGTFFDAANPGGVGSCLNLSVSGQLCFNSAGAAVTLPSNISMGSITVTAGPTMHNVPTGAGLWLTITNVDTSDFVTLTGTVTGGAKSTQSSLKITFSQTSAFLDTVQVNLQEPYLLVPPATNGGVTTLQADAAGNVPEPGTLSLVIGAGLLGLGILWKRR